MVLIPISGACKARVSIVGIFTVTCRYQATNILIAIQPDHIADNAYQLKLAIASSCYPTSFLAGAYSD